MNVVGRDCGSLFYEVCIKGYENIVWFLLENDVDINLCSENINVDINKIRIELGSLFYIVCKYGYEYIVSFLLNNGVNVNLCSKD